MRFFSKKPATFGSTHLNRGVSYRLEEIGKLQLARSAKVNGRQATVAITDDSTYKASGSIELDDSTGDELALGKFALKPGGDGHVKLKLTAAGVKAAKAGKAGAVQLTSDWDQQTGTKTIKLVGASAAAEHPHGKAQAKK